MTEINCDWSACLYNIAETCEAKKVVLEDTDEECEDFLQCSNFTRRG